MQKKIISPTVLLLVLGLVLVAAAAMVLRFVPLRTRYAATGAAARTVTYSATSSAAPSGLPESTSAHFTSGDALVGLGPNWTFIRQQDQTSMNMSYIDGTAPLRESVVQLINNPKIGLIIEESRIVDRKMLDKALAAKDVTKTEVATRSGYLVPMGSLDGGNSFVLTGSSTILILEDANAALWPEKLDAETAMYVRTVNVP